MGFVAFIVIGLVVGLVARAVMPGSQPMGLVVTLVLGVAGSFVGGFISTLVWTRTDWSDVHPYSFAFSVLGAVLVFAIGGLGRRALA